MKNKKLFRLIGAILMILQIFCCLLPYYRVNSMLVAEKEEITAVGDEWDGNVSAVFDALQKKESINKFQFFGLLFDERTELLEKAKLDTIPIENMKVVLIIMIILAILPAMVGVVGGIMGIILKSKKAFIVLTMMNFLFVIIGTIVNGLLYNRLQLGIEQALGEEIMILQSSLSAVGGNSDILSYLVAPGIGFFVTIGLSVLAVVFTVLCGFCEKSGVEEKTVTENVIPNILQPTPVFQKDGSEEVNGSVSGLKNQPLGVLRGLTGMYAGAEIALNGDSIVIGRDASRAHLVFDEKETKVSRKHCEVSYDSQMKMFSIIDYSSTGTYKHGKSDCLPQNMKVLLEPGTVIDIGDETNQFILE